MWDNAHHCHLSYWNSSLLILNASENREQPNAHSCPSLTPLPAAGEGGSFSWIWRCCLMRCGFFFFNLSESLRYFHELVICEA